MSQELAVTTNRDLPILPPETGRFDILEPLLTLPGEFRVDRSGDRDGDDEALRSDRTVVDPQRLSGDDDSSISERTRSGGHIGSAAPATHQDETRKLERTSFADAMSEPTSRHRVDPSSASLTEAATAAPVGLRNLPLRPPTTDTSVSQIPRPSGNPRRAADPLDLRGPAVGAEIQRQTMPGSKQSVRRAAGKNRRTPAHASAPEPRRDRSPAGEPVHRREHQRERQDDQRTAVSSDPLAALETPLIGGRYRVVSRIGEGGMGKVYKVTHAQLGKTFALKIINPNLSEEAKMRDLFYREARLASSLSHPNIASVVDFGEDAGRGAFMVMEFIEGEPLSKVLRRERTLSVRATCDIMVQVADALHYIHANRIVHCDIKTENILVCEVLGTKRRQKTVKLLDFGLARTTNASRNTGSLSGTPHYVAPERIRGDEATPSSDIYGLGVLFYELLTGKVPWDGNVAQILCGHLELAPTPPSELIKGGLDPALEKLVLHALAKTPAERHRDMEAFIYELRTVMDMLGYGRRSRGGRKVVIERNTSEWNKGRDELIRTMFDGSRLPMATIDGAGVILAANPAFAKFVMGVAVDVEGLRVQVTPLANAWPQFENDLARARSGHPVRRVVEVDVETGEVRRLMIWLDPGANEEHTYFGVHPLDA